MRCLSAVSATVVLCALAGAARADFGPNLLNNAGFESPLGFDFSNPSNWNGFFGGPGGTFLQGFNDTGAAPHSGAQALVTTIRGNAQTSGFEAFVGHVQVVTGITGGAEYELSIWARTNPLITNGAEFRVEWQDSAGVELDRFNFEVQGLLTSNYNLFSFTDVAPAGATRAAIVVAAQSFLHTGVIADTSVAWDDATLRTIPGPSSIFALAAFGSLLTKRRR